MSDEKEIGRMEDPEEVVELDDNDLGEISGGMFPASSQGGGGVTPSAVSVCKTPGGLTAAPIPIPMPTGGGGASKSATAQKSGGTTTTQASSGVKSKPSAIASATVHFEGAPITITGG